MKNENIAIQSNELFSRLYELIENSRKKIAVSANAELAFLYWSAGKAINENILHFERAEYGKQVIKNVAERLINIYGRGWSDKQLRHCLRVAETFSETEIVSAVQRQLSWTHLKTLSYENEPTKRKFYIEMSIAQKWNTRTLEGQIDKMLYERTAIAPKPEQQIEEALKELSETNELTPDLVFNGTLPALARKTRNAGR